VTDPRREYADRVLPPLTAEERATYEWQMWVPGVGEEGQRRLKGATVLVSRCGGLGGVVAYELAAAGVGKLVLAHAGDVQPGDLNRQLLMTHAALGTPRVACAARRLRELNPALKVVDVAENVCCANAAGLVAEADVVVDCAPLFAERFLLNEQAVRQDKPLVECAMYELTAQVTTVLPGRTACLVCRVPEAPPGWQRRFPVFGAVSGAVGCLGAMEAIKLICGLGEPLLDRLLIFDLRDMRFRTVRTERRPACRVCGSPETTRPRV
jgi:molybdopterin/thiamine biosynthesis adenylyltransferase